MNVGTKENKMKSKKGNDKRNWTTRLQVTSHGQNERADMILFCLLLISCAKNQRKYRNRNGTIGFDLGSR
jgi:hypothetical protein